MLHQSKWLPLIIVSFFDNMKNSYQNPKDAKTYLLDEYMAVDEPIFNFWN